MFTRYFRSFLLVLAAAHTVVVVAEFFPLYHGMLTDGLVLSVGRDYARGTAFWGLQFGLMLGVLGLQLPAGHLPSRSASVLLTAMCLLGATVFPISGFAILTLACGPLWVQHWRAACTS